ncbi:MAG: hypothetical protein IJT77_12035 [Clostridia bacterium]|nr:hypothetical protein [Clostridia bacterium]
MQKQTGRGSRSRYSTAGAVYDEREELYIAREMAGSARDKLRDNAYATRGVESPEPLLNQPARQSAPAARQQMGPLDALLREISRDRLSATLCVILFCLFLFLGYVYLQKRTVIDNDLRAIQEFRNKESYFLEKNAEMERALALAKSSERIRNQAQNSLGMLRREKAEVQEIYVQLPEKTNLPGEEAAAEESQFGLFDALLNLIGVLHL